MNKYRHIQSFVAVVLLMTTTFIHAQGNPLSVKGAWIPEAPPVASMNAGYLQLSNNADKIVRIVSASSDDYKSVEIHKTVTKDGMSRMIRQQELVIPAHDKAVFERGGLHLMLMHPTRPLKVGDKVVIRFETSDENFVTFTATVKPATLDDHSHHHH